MLLCYEHLIHPPATRAAKYCNHGDLIKEERNTETALQLCKIPLPLTHTHTFPRSQALRYFACDCHRLECELQVLEEMMSVL